MTDANDKNKGTPLTLSRPTLGLKKTVDVNRVHQSVAGGRNKSVQVEVRKKRSFVTDAHGNIQGVRADSSAGLDSEKAHRLKVLQAAMKADEEAKVKAEEEARLRAEREAKEAAERAEREKAEAEEKARQAAEDAKKVSAPAPAPAAKKTAEAPKPVKKFDKPAARPQQPSMSPEEA